MKEEKDKTLENTSSTTQADIDNGTLSLDELRDVSGGKRITSGSKQVRCRSCGWIGMVTTYTNGTLADCPRCHKNQWDNWNDTPTDW